MKHPSESTSAEVSPLKELRSHQKARAMPRLVAVTLVALVSIVASPVQAQNDKQAWKKLEFPSADGLKITGDLYAPHKGKRVPFILLCHQAGWSRGEYREIAPRLNSMGFNCLAIDQRSGGTINGVKNETSARATEKKLPTTYVDARQDIVAALRYVRKEKLARGALIAWGSSYSSALVIQITGTEKNIADGVVSFAPGEYFARFGKSNTWVQAGAAAIKKPVFITSAKDEKQQWKNMFAAIPNKRKASFVPETAGNHGSRALWKQFPDNTEYWKALTTFLDKNFPRKKSSRKKG